MNYHYVLFEESLLQLASGWYVIIHCKLFCWAVLFRFLLYATITKCPSPCSPVDSILKLLTVLGDY